MEENTTGQAATAATPDNPWAMPPNNPGGEGAAASAAEVPLLGAPRPSIWDIEM